MKTSTDSFIDEWINFEWCADLLVLVINLFFCSFYDEKEFHEFAIIITIYVFHHLRKFDDQIFTNMTKWTRFGIDIGCIMFYIYLCNPINQQYGVLVIIVFLCLLGSILMTIFMYDPSSNIDKREFSKSNVIKWDG